jgi:hypothetical protein
MGSAMKTTKSTALKRGIPHYQSGTPDVPAPERTFRQILGDAIGLRGRQAQIEASGVPVVPATLLAPESQPLDRIGPAAFARRLSGQQPATEPQPLQPVTEPLPPPVQIGPAAFAERVFGRPWRALTGQTEQVLQDPEASPFTRSIAEAQRASQIDTRARDATMGPTWFDKTTNYLFGNTASAAALAERDAAMKVLNQPLVQEHVRRDPNALAAVEKDPKYFAQLVQLPEYVDHMKRMQGLHVEALKDPKIDPNDAHKVVRTAADVNANPAAVNALMRPDIYSKEEFHRAIHGMPVQAVQMLFGKQLEHIVSPQEASARQYFNQIDKNYRTAAQKVAEMEAENALAIKERRNPPYQSTWFGKSPLDKMREEMEMWEKKMMEDRAAFIGVTGKPYPTPSR